MELHLKSVRAPAAASDGARLLVDRLWPRGMSKGKLSLTDWPKAVAPSNELRKCVRCAAAGIARNCEPRPRDASSTHAPCWAAALHRAFTCAQPRSWYGHEPSRWPEFQRRYRAELDGNAKAVSKLVDTLRRLSEQGSAATLLFGAHDEVRNNAVVLRDYLLERMPRRGEAGAAETEGGGVHAEVPTPRERERKRTAARGQKGDELPAATAGRRKRTRRASGDE